MRPREQVSFVCFVWNTGFREYRPEYVNALASQIRQHYQHPHRFVCVTDEPGKFDKGVEVMPLPESAREIAAIPSPEGPRFPASYRRLWAFSDEARCLGDRIMQLDVDAVIVGDLRPLFEPRHDFIGWRPRFQWGVSDRIGGGTWLLRTGTHAHIWDDFKADPHGWINKARMAGWRGSDQAYLSHRLAKTCHVWPWECGIYQSQDGVKDWETLPANARILHFNGHVKPWQCKPKWAESLVA